VFLREKTAFFGGGFSPSGMEERYFCGKERPAYPADFCRQPFVISMMLILALPHW
jgi:hypothetical protein